jgi:GNAT superfamily N-acetyltransferase
MKRLYGKPRFRKKGLGKLLAEGIIQKAKEMGYLKMKLDDYKKVGKQ